MTLSSAWTRSSVPAFHGLLPVRDEGDIIAQTLAHLLAWCDTLHILDTGGTDETWEIVQDAASRDPRIRLMGSHELSFRDTLRAWMFERARPCFRRGDWIARLDADEIYDTPPPRFVRESLRWPEGRIYAQHYEFVLRRSEADAWERGEETPADRARPIRDRRRWFHPDLFPEIRLFRYRRGMRWDPERYEPFNAGLLARRRIPVRHYRCRDPEQVARRCALRSRAAAAGDYPHWQQTDWRKWVIPDEDPRLREWTPGTPLPPVEIPGWAPRGPRRAAKWALYASGATNLLDLTRPRFPAASVPSVDPAPARA
jgi:glycosyltransferase involved in cell wall biosynthesis